MFRRKHWQTHNLYISIEKEAIQIHKNEEVSEKNISYILQFTDSGRLMASSLSNLNNNFSEEIDRIKCKYRHDHKKCKICAIEYK